MIFFKKYNSFAIGSLLTQMLPQNILKMITSSQTYEAFTIVNKCKQFFSYYQSKVIICYHRTFKRLPVAVVGTYGISAPCFKTIIREALFIK